MAISALRNSDQEAYNLPNCRRAVIELRCRVNFSELESEPHDERILAALEAKISGFTKGYGNTQGIDPLIKKWIKTFEGKVAKAEINSLAKAAGQASAKPKTTYKGKGGDKKSPP